MGPVTDYRTIGEWIETEGRVTRNFYSLTGGERTHPEVWKNYQDALVAAGFEIIAEGMFAERNVKATSARPDRERNAPTIRFTYSFHWNNIPAAKWPR